MQSSPTSGADLPANLPARATIRSTVRGWRDVVPHNNEAKAWGHFDRTGRLHETNVELKGYVSTLDNPYPGPRETANIEFYLINERTSGDVAGRPGTRRSSVFGVRVRFEPAPGLRLAASIPPSGTRVTAQGNALLWDVGDLLGSSYSGERSQRITLAVTPTSPGDEQCVVIEWTSDAPQTLHAQRFCLGDQPRLFRDGQVGTFTAYPCVSTAVYPCPTGDTVEVAAVHQLLHKGRSRGSGQTYRSTPDNPTVVIQVSDPLGRRTDAHSASVTSGGAPSWHTARDDDHNPIKVEGVQIGFFLAPFGEGQIAVWDNITEAVSVKGLNENPAPGRMKIRLPRTGSVYFDPNPSDENSPFDLVDVFPDYLDSLAFAEFSTLGAYVVDYTVAALHDGGTTATTDDVTYTGTGRAIFHVGPISELEARDAGASPGLGPDQRAYTIMAVNNGPDVAPAARMTLTGVPEDAEAIASEGSYTRGTCEGGLCQGVWDIGELIASEAYRASGHAGEGPTLTLVTASGGGRITATIGNARDYCVRIKTGDFNNLNDQECRGSLPSGYTEHTTKYYDHRPGNNSAQIAAHAGTGSYPGAPTGLTGVGTSVGHFVHWQPVETVNGFQVTHYEVQRLDRAWRHAADVTGTVYLDKDGRTGFYRYRVRAVNNWGVPGPWSKVIPEEKSVGTDPKRDSPPPKPDPTTGLTATPGDGYVDLEWRAGRSDGEVVWQLWRNDDPTWRDIFPRSVGSSNRGYTVTELENGVTYIFSIRMTHTAADGGFVAGTPSGLARATPTATLGQQSPPPPGQAPPPSGPNNPPEFDRDSVWYPETPWCANAGARRGTEVARFSATDPDGDSLQYFQRTGFEEIADAYFTVTTVTSGNVDYGVVRVSRTLPADLSPDDGFIIIDLEVIDGRGGLDQIGLSLQYDSTGGSCR